MVDIDHRSIIIIIILLPNIVVRMSDLLIEVIYHIC